MQTRVWHEASRRASSFALLQGHTVVAIYKSSNTIILASDSVYNNITVTDYELTTVALGDTVK